MFDMLNGINKFLKKIILSKKKFLLILFYLNFLFCSSLIQYHFNYLSNSSCLIYSASRSIPWFILNSNLTICNCPLLYAYKHGQLDGQLISCLHSLSGYETARLMNECDFDRI